MEITVNVPNLHVLKVRSLGHTETKPNRIMIRSERFRQTIIVSRNTDYRANYDQAAALLQVMGLKIVGMGEGQGSWFYLLSDTFMPIKGEKEIRYDKGRVELDVPSEDYGKTTAAGYVEDALRRGWLPCGDGSDYQLTELDKTRIKNLQSLQ